MRTEKIITKMSNGSVASKVPCDSVAAVMRCRVTQGRRVTQPLVTQTDAALLHRGQEAPALGGMVGSHHVGVKLGSHREWIIVKESHWGSLRERVTVRDSPWGSHREGVTVRDSPWGSYREGVTAKMQLTEALNGADSVYAKVGHDSYDT